MTRPVRVRFAPSPTGALHIGGVRTALYNYLFAKKHGGTFILRIEDTDQTRYVPGAEAYIIESLKWCGLLPDEGPGFGGTYGPYRQSERKDVYGRYAEQLVSAGHAYYAFDTVEELEAMRERGKEQGDHNVMYGAANRGSMRNSLSLSSEETQRLLDSGHPWTIRLKVPVGELIRFGDEIRGTVEFDSSELDDKVLLKADGMPTYHLANVVDDHLMEITHVIRGEEWLPSTAHHVLLYRFLGWEETRPLFAHLPLILKPNGNGKLSKRDGMKLGIPVFPLSWDDPDPSERFTGFREAGFDPAAVLNFLAFLGWNPGTEQELFTLEELSEVFSLEKVSKGGARFDFEKARWYNQQYIKARSGAEIASLLAPWTKDLPGSIDAGYLASVCELMKERVTVYPEILEEGYYFFVPVKNYDEATLKKKFRPELLPVLKSIETRVAATKPFLAAAIEQEVKDLLAAENLGPGNIFPLLRLAMAGTLKGPGLFEIIELLGEQEFSERMQAFYKIAPI